MRTVIIAATLVALVSTVGGAFSYVSGGPMQTTQKILSASNGVVTGVGDRDQKLESLKDLLRGFLDTEALGRQSMRTHLDDKTPEQQERFFSLFRDLFVRTYVQRLLLFDAPEFAFTEEKIDGNEAHIGTQIVTPRDRFAVDYDLQKTDTGWQATDIFIEDVSLSANFQSQFGKALKKNSFDDLMDRLERKLHGKKKDAAPPE
ncbi:MAG: ABC transporter substrate-binding protein [Candidatus Binatia bacterium]|nr:ABC transporter substrate-binding protein [Candidatus Binatia bacterium]